MSKITNMTIEEMEDALNEILPGNFTIKHTKRGLVINTNLMENEYGELVILEDEEDDEDSIFDEDGMESLSDDIVDE